MYEDQKLKVLEMISEGKITVDEGLKLLDQLGNGNSNNQKSQSRAFEEKIAEFAQNVEAFSRDMGSKMGTAFKDMEPKIRKATKVVFEKTSDVVEHIAKQLDETIKNMDQNSCCDKSECDCEDDCTDECDEACDCGCEEHAKSNDSVEENREN